MKEMPSPPEAPPLPLPLPPPLPLPLPRGDPAPLPLPCSSSRDRIRTSTAAAPVDRGRDVLEGPAGPVQRLGVPEEQVAAGRQVVEKPLHDRGPRLRVEIDQNVTAQDEIEGARRRVEIFGEVHPAEMHEAADLRGDLHLPLL